MSLVERFCTVFCPKRKWLKIILSILAIILFLFSCFLITAFTYAKVYDKSEKVYPGIYVGDYHVGGMEKVEIKEFTEKLNDKLGREGLDFTVFNSKGEKNHIKINTLIVSDDASVEIVNIDSDSLINLVYKFGRDGNWWQKLYQPISFKFGSHVLVKSPLLVDEISLLDRLESSLTDFADEPHNANLKIKTINPLNYDLVKEEYGKAYDYKKILDSIKDNLSIFSFVEIIVTPHEVVPTIFVKDLELVVDKLDGMFAYGNIALNHIDPQTKYRREWLISPEEFKDWIKVEHDEEENLILNLEEKNLLEFLKYVEDYVNRPAIDAKFDMSDGRVEKFQASRSGLELKLEETVEEIRKAFLERNYESDKVTKTVAVQSEIIEPKIKVSDVNDLGISEIIGVGISTFKDSHNNRIKNIANAVERLNGVLIKDGEEFSTNKYAGPYTLENGFLPEAVIKGNEIKDEVGGGMCQIGTTMFRLAMNGGFDITQRRNHSLVVSYYFDPVNGNPGTDATLYEPILDLKFLNNTGSYLLLQTEIDYKRQELKFILWGKPDGRKGWYTHPKVLKWIPYGEEEVIETEDLEPGVKKCQSAFTGAVASFTYSRVTPEGEKIDRIFESHYRPLQRICMIGIDPGAVKECEEGDEECVIEEDALQTSTSTEE